MKLYVCLGFIACSSVFATEAKFQESKATTLERSDIPTVGFDLTVNYGYLESIIDMRYQTDINLSTVAVSFANGTVTPVAKIEGSQAYKDEMLRMLYTAPGRFIDKSPGRTSSGLEDMGWRELTFEERSHPIPPPPPKSGSRVSSLMDTIDHYDRWHAPWIDFTIKTTPMDTMLQDLKTASEDFLGRQIQSAEVSVPLSLVSGKSQMHFDLVTALERVKLKLPRAHPENAAVAAIHGNAITKRGYLVCIDYSRSGLIVTALVGHRVEGELDIHRAIYRPDLGADFENITPDFWKQVRGEVGRALQNWDFDMVSDYVLIGDKAASEPQIMTIVKSMWEIRVVSDEMFSGDKSHVDYAYRGVDPVFAAAIGMARMERPPLEIGEPDLLRYSNAEELMNQEKAVHEL